MSYLKRSPIRYCPYTWEDLPQIMLPRELAHFLGCSEVSVRKKCADGTIPAFKDGKLWKIDRDKVRKHYEMLQTKGS